MTEKTEIKIEGDSIIYNGVKYEKVKKVPSEQPFKLRYLFADVLENVIADHGDFDSVMCNLDVIATTLLEEMKPHLPKYSDWEDGLNEITENTISRKDLEIFLLGWYAYSKKMWRMIDDV